MKRLLAVALSAAMIVSSASTGFAADESLVFMEESVDAGEASSLESTEESAGDSVADDFELEVETEDSDEASSEASEEESLELSSEDASLEELEIEDEAASVDTTEVAADEAELMANEPSPCFGVSEDGTLTWVEGKGNIPDYAYIPEGVKRVPEGIFTPDRMSRKDTTIHFLGSKPEVVIEKDAFRNCLNLKSVKGKAIKTVESNAFTGCVGLVMVEIENAERIEDSAFFNIAKLESVKLGSGLKYIGEYAFFGTALKELNLASIITKDEFTIGANAFQSCTKLTRVTLPDVLKEVPAEAFSGCEALSTVTFGSVNGKLHTIGTSAFAGCKSLSSLEFYNVKTYGNNAFANCSDLQTIKINYRGSDISISDSAFPANPKNWKITMIGYSPEIKQYAIKHKYTYHGAEHTIKVICDSAYDGQFTGQLLVNNKAVSKAEEDETVTAVIIPKEGYSLKSIKVQTHNGTTYDEVDILKSKLRYLGEKDKALSFEVTMQDQTTYIRVEMIANDKIKSTYSAVSMKLRDNVDGKIGSTGTKDQVVIRKQKDDSEVGPWLWTFTSSANGSLPVSEDGSVTALGEKDNITLTATLKADTTVKLTCKVSVKGTVEVKSITLDNLETEAPVGALYIPGSEDASGLDVIEVMNYYNKSTDLVFKVTMDAHSTEDNTDHLFVKSNWSSVDSNIASVGAATVYNNANNIIVKKGARGETMITISVLNKGEKNVSIGNSKSFIVRIVDPTPRLRNSDITVNYSSSYGSELKIEPVRGFPVDPYSLKLVDVNGKESKELQINYKNGKYYIGKHNNNKNVKKKEYIKDAQLYLAGAFDGGSKGVEFTKIAIARITLTDKPLTPTIKVKSKINLFYKGSNGGVVEVIQSIKNYAVTDYELVSKERKANSKLNVANDKFHNNFDISYDADSRTFSITRKDSAVLKTDGKAVATGFLKISYDGYDKPVYLELTVPTEVAKPGYALSTKTATKNNCAKDHEFDLQITRKVKEDGKKVTQVLDIDPSLVNLTYDSEAAGFEILSVEDNTIRLKHNGYATNAKAQIVVHQDEWGDDLTFTFNLKATDVLPATKVSVKSVTLNRNHPEESAVFELGELSDGQYESVRVLPTGKNAADIAAFDYAGEGKVTVTLKSKSVASGTYSFSVIPTVDFGTMKQELKGATVKVVVTDLRPVMKLKDSTLTFNANYPGMETVSTTYSLTNLPAGTEKNVEITELKFTPNGHGYKFENVVDMDRLVIDGGNISAAIKDSAEVNVNRGKTLKFNVTGRVKGSDEEAYIMEPFTISIKLSKAVPSVTVKASGSINPIDRNSKVKYTATVKNINIDDPGYELVELDDKGVLVPVAKHKFEIVQDETKKNVAYIKVKDGESVENGKKYKLRIRYTNIPLAKESKVNITPKQVLPKIKTDVKSKTIFALQENRSFNVHVTHKVDKNSPVLKPEMTGIEWHKDTPAAVRRAFKFDTVLNEEDLTTGDVKIELVNPAALVQNKEYTLTFAVAYKDQAANSTGNKITVKVTVKK